MKFTVLQQDFLPALQAVARSVGVRASLPVLENVLLSIENSELKILATNLEIGVIKFVPVEVIESGEITVPAKTIVEIISALKQSKIEIEADLNILTVSSGKFKAAINGIPATEFPAIPLSGDKSIVFKKEILSASSQILYAAAVDEGRPVLTGILTHVKNGVLDFVATDGFRLAHRQVSIEDKESEFKAIIPKRTFEEVLRILGENAGAEIGIAVSPDHNQAIFNFNKVTVSSRLIEGNYPGWEKIIPTKLVTKITVDKDDLSKAIKLAAIFAKNEANVIVLNINQFKISIESSAKEVGSQQNEVDGIIEGEELKVAFNVKFLQDAISNVPSAQVVIQFSGPLSPALIKPIDESGLEYVVMPVRVN